MVQRPTSAAGTPSRASWASTPGADVDGRGPPGRLGERLRDRCRHLGAHRLRHLVARAADVRSEPGLHLARAEPAHDLYGTGHDAGDQTRAAGVHGTDHSGVGVGQQHRHAVGGPAHQHHAGQRGHQARRRSAWARRRCLVNDVHVGTVHLVHQHQASNLRPPANASTTAEVLETAPGSSPLRGEVQGRERTATGSAVAVRERDLDRPARLLVGEHNAKISHAVLTSRSRARPGRRRRSARAVAAWRSPRPARAAAPEPLWTRPRGGSAPATRPAPASSRA